jgi:hypothetical protein
MDKTLCALLILLASGAATADPAPFGLELGSTTQGEAGVRYLLHPAGLNALTLGEQFELDGRQLPVAGLKTVTLVFGVDRRLLAVVADVAPDRYAALYALLAGKYRPVASAGPGNGDRFARFLDGDSEIVLTGPSGGADLKLSYVHRRFSKMVQERRGRAAEERRSGEAAQL